MAKRSIPLRNYFLLNINLILRFLILSDVVIVGATGLFGPVFAIFILDFIEGGNAAVAGIAAALYLVSRSVLQIPIATFIDKIRGEKDDFLFLFLGSILSGLTPLLYLVINTPIELYLLQILYGVFVALRYPSYMAIFTRHIDKHKEGSAWGIYFTMTDIGGALAASIGGYLASTVGFPFLILCVVVVNIFGALILLPIRPYLNLKSPEQTK